MINATKDISDEIHRKNKNILEKIFIISFIFGIIAAICRAIRTHAVISYGTIYYFYYAIVGFAGFFICKIRKAKYFPGIFCLICFFLVFLFYISYMDFTEALIFFFGFIIAIELLLNLNPIVFTIYIIVAELAILLCALLHLIPLGENLQYVVVENIVVVNLIVIHVSFWKRRIVLNKYITEKKIKAEQQKSDELLLNVLPERVIEHLKTKGSVDPEAFENVSVFFCQVVNYEELSEDLGPEKLVNELNEVFSVFDDIVEKNSCMRIKTMGEIYMGVCGLPTEDPLHAEHSVTCTKEFVEYIQKHNEASPVKLLVRAGVSSGSVIAGIVGIKKYIYDIFGDTVNTAYRMKGLSSAMQIKVSPVTYELVKDKFEFKKQTPVDVKGKGPMETYNLDI